MIKPFYFDDYVAIVFKSIHEDDDWMIILREEKYKNTYMRVCAHDAEEAATIAYQRHKKMKVEMPLCS